MNDLPTIAARIQPLGFSLDERQPYISGERFLMAGGKLVLAGTRDADGVKVIIKASNHVGGIREIRSEKRSRDLMRSLSFATEKILLPEELYFGTSGGYQFLVMRFIPQDKIFVAHTLEEQFFTALSAFEAQEAFHATTFEHLRTVKEVFPVLSAHDYLKDYGRLHAAIVGLYPDPALHTLLLRAKRFLTDHLLIIDRYGSYLTHTDFVPHNFRVIGRALYMLDCVPNAATVHFGNKYEGWARFINYMTIHNPELEKLLVEYVRHNRGEDEYLSLRLMRVYKIVFLLGFYARALAKTTGNLHELTLERLSFWREALAAALDDRFLDPSVIERYRARRNALRSEEEKERQKDFAAT